MSHYSPNFLKHPHKHPKERHGCQKKKRSQKQFDKTRVLTYCGRSGTALLFQLAAHKVIIPDKSHLVDPKMALSEKHPLIHGQRLSASASCL